MVLGDLILPRGCLIVAEMEALDVAGKMRKMTRAQLEAARRLYEKEGWTMKRIAETYAVTRRNIFHHFKRMGVPLRSPGRRPEPEFVDPNQLTFFDRH